MCFTAVIHRIGTVLEAVTSDSGPNAFSEVTAPARPAGAGIPTFSNITAAVPDGMHDNTKAIVRLRLAMTVP